MKTITDTSMHNLDLTDNTKLQINYRTKRISSHVQLYNLYTQLYMYVCTCTIYIFCLMLESSVLVKCIRD